MTQFLHRAGANLASSLLAGFILAGLLLAGAALAKDWPRPEGPLADYAKVVDAQHQRLIEAAGRQVFKKTGVAIVVATLPSLENESLEEAAARLFRSWGIGKKGQDKGVLIIVAVAQRRVRIEVGYGLEGVLTDAKSGQIRDQVLVPHLREGRYGQGLYEAMSAIAQLVASEAKVSLEDVPKTQITYKDDSPYGSWWAWGAVFMVVLLYILAKARRLAGGGGDGSGAGGFLAGLLMGSMLGGRRGGGDNSSGSNSGGGNDDFGGFDGGDSGGGGASGDY